MTKVNINGKLVHIDTFLLQKLESIKKIIKKNWDCVILIDGEERSGKSTLGMTIGNYLDPDLSLNNIASGLDDAKKKIQSLPDKSVLIVDEGSLVFNSKDALNKAQKELMKILDVVGQKNMVIIVVLPSIFDLNKTIAVRRSRFLLHVYTNKKMDRGKFAYFSKKKKAVLYELGKKKFGSYSKPKANFVGNFVKFDPFGEAYKEVKKKSLMEALTKEEKNSKEEYYRRRFFLALKILSEDLKISQRQIAKKLNENGLEISQQGLNGGIKALTVTNNS